MAPRHADRRRLYSDEDLTRAVSRCIAGEKMTVVHEHENIQYSTLKKYVSMRRAAGLVDPASPPPALLPELLDWPRRGVKPRFTKEVESDLADWIEREVKRMKSDSSCAPTALSFDERLRDVFYLDEAIPVVSDGMKCWCFKGWKASWCYRYFVLTNF